MKNESRQNHFRSRAYHRQRALALTVALILPLLRVSRVLGQAEDEVGYRKSYYQEDSDRIHVSTDTWQFDVGLKQNVRVSGEVVVDAISGATPNGAPPPAQWPRPTYNYFYQPAYQAAYSAAYDYKFGIGLNQVGDPNFPNVPDLQAVTNQAIAYALLHAPQTASNNANANWQTLTNSANYRGRKVPVQEMHDHRNAFNLALPITLDRNTITPSFAYSCESDYVSFGGALSLARTYNDKNTTVTAGWGHNQDRVRDDNFNWQAKMTDDVFLGLVQLCGPKAYLTINASLSFEHGYLADPYRQVMYDELQTVPGDGNPFIGEYEIRPHHRNSEIFYISWIQFITPLNASYEVGYRFFHDSYGVFANTLQADWHQKIGKKIIISPTFRYYVQNAADFYYLTIDPNNKPTFFTADWRMSEMQSFAAGIEITWRLHKHFSLDASYMRYEMSGLDGTTSQSAYPSANLISFGARAWF